MLTLRPRSTVLVPARRGETDVRARARVRVRVGESSSTEETSTTTTESTFASRLPLYALYLVLAGVAYYVGYELVTAAWASRTGRRVHYLVR